MKAARHKQYIFYKGRSIQMTTNFSTETIEVRKFLIKIKKVQSNQGVHHTSERMNVFPRLPEQGFPGGASGKEAACQCTRLKRHRFHHPWVGKIPWRRSRQPTPVFLPGKSHAQRSLESYGPWGCKEMDILAYTHSHLNCP